jgi:hypothetical protein
MNKISKGDQGSPYTKEEKRAKKREEFDEDFSKKGKEIEISKWIQDNREAVKPELEYISI